MDSIIRVYPLRCNQSKLRNPYIFVHSILSECLMDVSTDILTRGDLCYNGINGFGGRRL